MATELTDSVLAQIAEHGLVQHGLAEEAAQWRAHVCFPAQQVWIFSKAAGLRAMDKVDEMLGIWSDGKLTAIGKLIPLTMIEGAQKYPIPKDVWDRYEKAFFSNNESTKGLAAETLVSDLIKSRFPDYAKPTIVPRNTARQISGIDLDTDFGTVQVKCDMKGGEPPIGTGNLFIQTHESNPESKH